MQVDGNTIKRLRKLKGLTARELANQTSISTAHLSLIENNRRNPGPHVAARLAQALGTSIVDLRRS